MNLIPCDQGCKHQQEGYCTLNHIASLTSNTGAKCGYFALRKSDEPDLPTAQKETSAPYYADSL